MDATPSPDDLDAIAGALARMRGRGPGGRGPGADGFPHHDGAHHHDGGHPRGGFGPGGFGPGGFGPGGRMASPARVRLLDALAAASHPLTISELGEAIGVDQPRASRLIQQAVELGLVRREPDPDDARRTRVALTDEGSRIATRFRGQRREHLAQALAGFSDAERADLVRLLTKLADAWPRRD